MSFIKAFKTPNNQKFEFHPRHWDPKKEEMERRKKELANIKSMDPEDIKSRISQGLRRGGKADPAYRSNLVRKSNYRLLGIIVILIVLSYLAITIYLPQVMDSL